MKVSIEFLTEISVQVRFYIESVKTIQNARKVQRHTNWFLQQSFRPQNYILFKVREGGVQARKEFSLIEVSVDKVRFRGATASKNNDKNIQKVFKM